MDKGRIMGIDFGMRHIGVAMSDVLRITAQGYETVNWNGIDAERPALRIAEIIKENNVTEIVMGKPSKTDGSVSESELKAKLFGELIERETGIKPVFRDERYTTVIASRMLHENNMKAKKQKKIIDQVAAEIILREYLEQKR